MTAPDPARLAEIEMHYDAAQLALSDGASSAMRQLHRLSVSANDVPYLLTLARKQAAALDKVRAAADYWAKLADGDKYYAKQVHDAIGDNR